MSRRLAFVLAACSIMLVALASGLRPDAFYVGDPGVKLVAARNALAFPSSPLEIPLPLIGTDRTPHVDPFFAVHGTHAHAVTSELFPLTSAPFLALFGMRGLYVWPALGFIAAIAGCAWLAFVLDPGRDGAIVAAVAALGTPWLFYGLEFWEHAPAIAAGTAGTALLLDGSRRRPGTHSATGQTFAAGLLAGLAVVLRPEAAWFVGAVAIASRTLVHRPSWRSLAVACAGAGTAMLPLELHTLLHYGTLVPAHVGPNATLVGERWLDTRLDLALGWLVPSGWNSRGPVEAADLWSVAPAAVIALLSLVGTNVRDERRFLWLVTSVYVLLVLLTAPNLGGGQWGPRYLLFAYVPLTVLAADLLQELLGAGDGASRRGPRAGPPGRWAIALVVALLVASVWVQRTGYRQLRGTKATYGRIVDFVSVHTTPDRQVVTDVWWLDQLAAAALGDQNVLYAGNADAGQAIVRRLSELTTPTVTVFRSRDETPAPQDWTDGTCYFEEQRDDLDVRGIVAIRLTHRCGYKP